MEPQFEQKPSVEFEKPHRILLVRDVVFALRGINDETPHGKVSDAEYIGWVYDVLSYPEGFGQNALREDAKTLKSIISQGDDDIYKAHAETVLGIAEEMDKKYESNIQQTASELTAFLSRNPGLFLWTQEPDSTIDEIIVEKQQDGSLRPYVHSTNLCIDINRMNEQYREFIINDLYE